VTPAARVFETQPLETAHALTTEARFHHLAGRHRKAVELLERAERIAGAPKPGEPVSAYQGLVLTLTYAFLAGAYQHLGLFADGDRWAWRAVEFGTAHGVLGAQASGFEFLGEHATSTGEWEKGLEYVEKEREIGARLHSRERLAWSCLVAGICSMKVGNVERAEREFREGIALSLSIGEKRLVVLLRGSLAILEAESGRLDDALRTATDNVTDADKMGLLHMRADGRRCLAHVLWKRGELAEALRNCDELLAITSETESRQARLWVGPIHVEVLLALGRREEAASRLDAYAEMVASCQSRQHTEAVARLEARLAESIGS